MNVMIDIETLSTEINAKILSVGLCLFGNELNQIDLDKCKSFYVKFSYTEEQEKLFHVCPKTIEWWNNQNKKVYSALLSNDDKVNCIDGLNQIRDFLNKNGVDGRSKIWANSPSFDCVILHKMCDELKIQRFWNFWQERDLRTILDFTNIKLKKNNHNALDDAKNQVEALKEAMSKIKIG